MHLSARAGKIAHMIRRPVSTWSEPVLETLGFDVPLGARPPAPLRDCRIAGLRDCGIAGLRHCGAERLVFEPAHCRRREFGSFIEMTKAASSQPGKLKCPLYLRFHALLALSLLARRAGLARRSPQASPRPASTPSMPCRAVDWPGQASPPGSWIFWTKARSPARRRC